MGARCQFRAGNARRFVRRHGSLDDAPQLIEVERIETDQLRLKLLLDQQRWRIAVTFTETDVAIVALDLDDRAQRERLVNPAGIEQRRITERDGGDGDSFDFQEAAPFGPELKA